MIVGDVLAERYELEELVGAGGMSSVYRAHDRVLDRRVALKILHKHFNEDAEYVERFRREARVAATLSHRNVVTVIDRGEQDDCRFIVFEYVEGETLKSLITREGPVPVEQALKLAIQVARGLTAAHERGLIHRDVKPHNVLLNGAGEAKVTDFGIARELHVQDGMTVAGTVLGTSDYIAPEQAQGRRVDEQTDVYSLGVVLYELLTGEVPFTGENFMAVALRHINDPPPPVRGRRPDVPPRVAAAVERALAKDPRDRFRTMSGFAEELEACLIAVLPGSDDAPTQRVRLRAPRRRPGLRPVLLIAAGLVLLAVVLGIALTQGGDGGGTPSGGGGSGSGQVVLRGAGVWDPPPGDGSEHTAAAPNATDGSPGTFWETERYHDAPSLGKPGVGLVLDAGETTTLRELTVTTDTPGFLATIRAGDSPSGPFRDVSGSQSVGARTTFTLDDTKARYFVVWITRLPPGLQSAHVNEVTAG